MSTIVKFVPAAETEIAMGVFASTPGHWSISIGEYADQGEADADIRVIGAVDEDGKDISDSIASLIARIVTGVYEEESNN